MAHPQTPKDLKPDTLMTTGAKVSENQRQRVADPVRARGQEQVHRALSRVWILASAQRGNPHPP